FFPLLTNCAILLTTINSIVTLDGQKSNKSIQILNPSNGGFLPEIRRWFCFDPFHGIIPKNLCRKGILRIF
ncbi:MAG: hypothetical protein ACKO4R_11405, partial [Synechococcales cyanobacterium]